MATRQEWGKRHAQNQRERWAVALEGQDKALFEMLERDGLTYEQIAIRLGISRMAVYHRISKARRRAAVRAKLPARS